jgi:hypothetical protein
LEGRLIKSTDIQVWGLNQSGTIRVKLASNVLENVFPNLTGVQNRDLNTVSYVVGILNNHATLALTSVRIYFRILDARGATLAMALDTLGPAVKTGVVWSPGSPPATFTTPVTVGTGLSVATLNPGFVQAVWIKRTAIGGSSYARPEKNTLTVTGTSLA